MIKKIDHFVITTANLSDSVLFYSKLGFQTRNAGARFEFFAGDFKINVHLKGQELEPKAKYVQTGSADLCFELDCSLEDCKRTLAEKGLKLELDETLRHGVRGEMKSVYLRDPDENLIELCCYE